jgi:glycosyltransferase involved in cell wall biosynthesis
MVKPKFSIIIPCYNEAFTIVAVLEAIANQTYSLKKVEVLIADGMSIDDTRQNIQIFFTRNSFDAN